MRKQRLRDWEQNRLNLKAGSRAQQTCRPACGATRQSREKRQRRKVLDTWQWRVDAQRPSGLCAGQDARWASAEGRSLENHKRGSSNRSSFRRQPCWRRGNRRIEPLGPTLASEGEGKERGSSLAGNREQHHAWEGLVDCVHSTESQGGKR